jgi:hypothetical protein
MTNRVLVWIEDRVKDFPKEQRAELREYCAANNLELQICGEGKATGPRARSEACLTGLIEFLNSSEDLEVCGFVIDIQIPVANLEIMEGVMDGMRRVKTNLGADTGYQIARYVLANKGGGNFKTPYGDRFKDKPVLFLTISSKASQDNEFVDWMGVLYQEHDPKNTSQYQHLEKTFERPLLDQLRGWIDWIKEN